MSFTAGDLSHNIAKIMQDFAKAEKGEFRIVRELTRLLTKLKQVDFLPELDEFCRMENDLIVKVFPSLKKPIAEFNRGNPHKKLTGIWWGYEDVRRANFEGYLERALASLDEEIVEY